MPNIPPETARTSTDKQDIKFDNGKTTSTNTNKQAIKLDNGKTDWAILPIGASEEIIKVFEFGAKKYARGNFKEGTGLEYSRVLNSLLRHVYAFMQGQDTDPETGLSHLAHAGCNIYMLLTYELQKEKYSNDDRKTKVMV